MEKKKKKKDDPVDLGGKNGMCYLIEITGKTDAFLGVCGVGTGTFVSAGSPKVHKIGMSQLFMGY